MGVSRNFLYNIFCIMIVLRKSGGVLRPQRFHNYDISVIMMAAAASSFSTFTNTFYRRSHFQSSKQWTEKQISDHHSYRNHFFLSANHDNFSRRHRFSYPARTPAYSSTAVSSFSSATSTNEKDLGDLSININPDETYVLCCHGMSRKLEAIGSSCGLAIYDVVSSASQMKEKLVWSGGQYFRSQQNRQDSDHQATLKGIHTGLKMAYLLGIQNIIVVSDSKIIVDKLNPKQLSSKNDNESKIYYQILSNMEAQFKSHKVKFIPKEYNSKAKAMAQKSLKMNTSHGLDLLQNNKLKHSDTHESNTVQNNDENVLQINKNQNCKDSMSEVPLLSAEKTYLLRFSASATSTSTKGSTKNASAGIGLILLDSETNEECWHGRKYIGEATMNEAAYIGLLLGLRCAKAMGVSKLIVQGNMLIIRQLNGEYAVKSESLKQYYDQIKELIVPPTFSSFEAREFEKSSVDKVGVNQLATDARKLKNTHDCHGLLMFHHDEALPPIFNTDITADDNFNEKCIMDSEDNTIFRGDMDQNENALLNQEQQSHTTSTKESYSSKRNNLDEASQKEDDTINPVSGVKIHPKMKYILQFDGGSRGNPGIAGSGFVLYDEEGNEIFSGRYALAHATNNEAEYSGIVQGLKLALSLQVCNIIVEGDSQLIIRQIEGVYKVKNANLRTYYKEAIALRKKFDSFQVRHIPREQNSRADELANEAMDAMMKNS